eukprot:07076.XXX_384883_385400_1 [CDS] Oithona nana genome sequencing.
MKRLQFVKKFQNGVEGRLRKCAKNLASAHNSILNFK